MGPTPLSQNFQKMKLILTSLFLALVAVAAEAASRKKSFSSKRPKSNSRDGGSANLDAAINQADQFIDSVLKNGGGLDMLTETTKFIFGDAEMKGIGEDMDFDDPENVGEVRRTVTHEAIKGLRPLRSQMKAAIHKMVPRMIAAKEKGLLDTELFGSMAGDVMDQLFQANPEVFALPPEALNQSKERTLSLLKENFASFQSMVADYVSRANFSGSRRQSGRSGSGSRRVGGSRSRRQSRNNGSRNKADEYMKRLQTNELFSELDPEVQKKFVDTIITEGFDHLVKEKWSQSEIDAIDGYIKKMIGGYSEPQMMNTAMSHRTAIMA